MRGNEWQNAVLPCSGRYPRRLVAAKPSNTAIPLRGKLTTDSTFNESHHLDIRGGKQNRLGAFPNLSVLRGGDDGIRTHDPHVANVMLSQLSYIPTYGRADAQFGILPFGTAFVKEGGSPSLIEHAGGARLAPP